MDESKQSSPPQNNDQPIGSPPNTGTEPDLFAQAYSDPNQSQPSPQPDLEPMPEQVPAIDSPIDAEPVSSANYPTAAASFESTPPSITAFPAEEGPHVDPLSPPSKKGSRVRILLAITGFLILVLIGTIWYFFLQPKSPQPVGPTPTPTSTGTAAATPTPSENAAETHLECRFGLCVQVPGVGENLCSSSFDCELTTGTPTSTPTPTATAIAQTSPTITPAVTIAPTASPTTAVGAPQPTSTPTNTPTPTTAPTLAPTITPTPLAPVLPESGSRGQTNAFAILSFFLVSGGIYFIRKAFV